MENTKLQERNFNLWQLAHWSQRLLNFIIDISLITGFQILIMYLFKDIIIQDSSKINLDILFVVIAFTYYYFFEYYTGKTIGKFLTKTRVLTDGGLKPSKKIIFIRTLCRFIPFEILSCFNERAHGWHNTLSKTIVIPDSEI
jgi:uncharacterized RDD family membrane protein YckC